MTELLITLFFLLALVVGVRRWRNARAVRP